MSVTQVPNNRPATAGWLEAARTSLRFQGVVLFGLLVVLGYWVIVGVIEGTTGAFLGKRILGLRVVGNDGARIGPTRGALRGF